MVAVKRPAYCVLAAAAFSFLTNWRHSFNSSKCSRVKRGLRGVEEAEEHMPTLVPIIPMKFLDPAGWMGNSEARGNSGFNRRYGWSALARADWLTA